MIFCCPLTSTLFTFIADFLLLPLLFHCYPTLVPVREKATSKLAASSITALIVLARTRVTIDESDLVIRVGVNVLTTHTLSALTFASRFQYAIKLSLFSSISNGDHSAARAFEYRSFRVLFCFSFYISRERGFSGMAGVFKDTIAISIEWIDIAILNNR